MLASDGQLDNQFGSAVSILGNRALAGAPGKANSTGDTPGAVYVFERDDTAWSQAAKLTDPNGSIDDFFGYSIYQGAGTALIGANGSDCNGSLSGIACLFELSGSSWAMTRKYAASDGMSEDNFGSATAMSADWCVVGAFGCDDDRGAAYAYSLTGGEPNGAPQARDDEYGNLEVYMSAEMPVLVNDTDPDGDIVKTVSVTQPSHGRATATDTAIVYTPVMGYVGTDSFTYTIDDGRGGTSTAGVTVTIITGPEDNPSLRCPLTATGTAGQVWQYELCATGLNPIGYQVSGLPAGLTFDGAYTISGTPAAAGTTDITLTATNPAGSDTRVLTLAIGEGVPLMAITEVGVEGGSFRIGFGSNPSWSYDVLYKDDLMSTNPWQALTNDLQGDGGVIEFVDAESPNQRFYKVEASMP